MLRFGGFKATFKLKSRKRRDTENENVGEPICSAYRINRDEFLSNNGDPTKRNTTPIVQMTYTEETLKPSKSTNDIINRTNPASNVRQSMPDIAIAQPKPVPRINKNEREQKKVEKQQLAEQKKKEKLALQEQQRQEKIKKEREKQQKLEQAKSDKNKQKKRAAPQPQVNQPAAVEPNSNPQGQNNYPTNTLEPNPNPQGRNNYPTNTLESSISRSSGPPPYTAEPDLIPNQKDNTGNTSFSTPAEDLGSWDIISQHREQLNRPKATSSSSKQTHMDLRYNMMDLRNKDNSEA